MASVEKTYADALFTLLEEENSDRIAFTEVLSQLKKVELVLADTPDFIKLLNTPTVSGGEKLALVETAFSGRVSDYVYNFLRLLTVKKRMAHFPRIFSSFRGLYNERFDIAEIVVTSAMPLTADLREKITARMTAITGKTVSVIERVDKSILGGVVVDYGNTRLDGSVKTRLAELKKDIAGIIA
jgi:F-type H+-transporting ATPase subunit delta